ncbi:MAG: hypothetical protein IPN29_08860 [Saprospiraceae bacterium]|nr:hypothetical protein [Saprospiraceae bacterium]
MVTYSSFDHHTSLQTIADYLSSLIVEMKYTFLSWHPTVRAERSRPGSWSKKEILGHLVDSARYNLIRFTEIPAATRSYHFKSHVQKALVSMINYQYQEDESIQELWTLLK